MTPSETEPASFQLAAQYLNQPQSFMRDGGFLAQLKVVRFLQHEIDLLCELLSNLRRFAALLSMERQIS